MDTSDADKGASESNGAVKETQNWAKLCIYGEEI